MKIILDYDLMDKVRAANGIINLKKILLTELKKHALAFLGASILETFYEEKSSFSFKIIAISILFSVKVLIDITLIEQTHKDLNIHAADLDIIKLSLQLYDYSLKTTPELLKEAELMQTVYNIKFNEKYFPIIEQKKYILIPTYDSLGNLKETTLLQEHELNSNTWVLSLGSPSKVLKLSYNHV